MIRRALLGALLTSSLARAQATDSARGMILGVVTDSSLRPVAGADVSFAGSPIHVATDSLGRFRVTRIPAGQFVLVARSIGYAPAINLVDVEHGDTLRLAITLENSARVLETVVVTERTLSRTLADFEYRRKFGMGRFYTRDDIETKNVATITELIRPSFGLRLQPVSGGGNVAYSNIKGCPLEVYLDGTPMSRRGSMAFDLNYLPQPDQIVAVEIYARPSDVPPSWLLSGGSQCGAILVWTRVSG
jgi:hypothetical protein